MMTSSRTNVPLILGSVGITLLSGCVQMVQPDPHTNNKTIQGKNGKNEPIVITYPQPTVSCYRVKSGDTLYRIANDHGYDYQQVAAWNGLQVTRWDGQKPVYDLQPGQVLRVTPANVTCRAG